MYLPRGPNPLVDNEVMGELCAQFGIPYVDLSEPFRRRWERDRLPFEYAHEYHWNAHGHRVVAETIADQLGLFQAGREIASARGVQVGDGTALPSSK